MPGDEPDAPGLAARLHRIEAVTDPDLARLDVADLLSELLDRVRELLTVDTAAVLLRAPSGDHLFATAARGIDEEVHQGVRIPVGKGFAGRVAQEKRPITLEEVTSTTVHNPLLLEKGIRSLLGVPLVVGDEVLGVLHVGTLTPRRFTDQDTNLLQLVADRVALSVHARLSHEERAAAAALQRSLLPPALPAVADLECAARYVPGNGNVGGDWYDVFELPSGSLCIIVGDVAGNGLAASMTMGRLRTVFRAYALEVDDPAELISKVDRHVHYFEPPGITTVLCAMLDPTHRKLLLSIGGHPPPILAEPDRLPMLLELPVDLPLGVDSTEQRHTSTITLSEETCLCFYTDGLVERRHSTIDAGFERLRAAMFVGHAETVCATLMSRLIGSDIATDDVAILTLSLMHDSDCQSAAVIDPWVPDGPTPPFPGSPRTAAKCPDRTGGAGGQVAP
jgi:phosphoserine phosphatase RsbU/P